MGLLREQGSLTPSGISAQLKVSKQGALIFMRPLLGARMIVKSTRGNTTGSKDTVADP